MEQTKKFNLLIPILILFSLVFIYFFPRFLVDNFGIDNPWTNFFYLYGFGGYFFGLGILLIIKSGSCTFGRGRDTLWFTILCSGFLFFMSLHALWIYLSISIPVFDGVN